MRRSREAEADSGPFVAARARQERAFRPGRNGKIDEQSILAHLHQLPPFHVHAVGDASRFGLKAAGSVHGEVAGSGTAVVAGKTGYARTRGTWYDLGRMRPFARLLGSASWTGARGSHGRMRVTHSSLHVTKQQLEKLTGLRLPFGIDGADASVTLRFSRWGEPVTITPPRSSVPICLAEHTCGKA